MEHALAEPITVAVQDHPRVSAAAELDPSVPSRVTQLVALAVRGLATAYDPVTATFAQTVRGVTSADGVTVVREGTSLRYAAMAALGLSRLTAAQQRSVLDGRTAADIALQVAGQAITSDDPGEIALAAWAAAEVADTHADALLRRLAALITSGAPIATVAGAWALTAAVKAAPHGDTEPTIDAASALLRRHLGPRAVYPHALPPSSQQRWRAHVGSFADQVYPLQALALGARLTGETWMLQAADRTAQRLCDLQGPTGQWWWHYDVRDGSVVEDYPVYSVHQHAMAPMVLHDLRECGGADHRASITSGLSWLRTHPETVEELISDRFGLIWRKVGRREPPKAARALGAVTTGVRPGLHLPGIDRLFPAGVVDHECRPYELGWLLYAWLSPVGERDD
ncbi:hypothetical protein [Nocardioides albus]|uniref:Uncharacterized protein n=1 Tax=Nocardioides albus TaxID=1841 RepID=A0A7W5F6U1_9ACTN|nr:hypothetical protein [Nocardioides albus]MBB3087147.1 hypothetical protein [Nocardioides albus]GGU06964.1 hypothetical protein GCM10007979_00680 [Nocardioides albus]